MYMFLQNAPPAQAKAQPPFTCPTFRSHFPFINLQSTLINQPSTINNHQSTLPRISPSTFRIENRAAKAGRSLNTSRPSLITPITSL